MRFCSKCGRLYDETQGHCVCWKPMKRNYRHESFYDSLRWKKLSKLIKVRDFCTDRLVLYLLRSEMPQERNEDGETYKLLHDYLIDVYGNARRLSDRLICHHIIPREYDYSKQYDADNLITLSNDTHEYIHQLYAHNRENQVQQILRNAVMADLP